MFMDANLYDGKFITDDKEFRDSYYEEFLDIVEQNYKPYYNPKKEPDFDIRGACKRERERCKEKIHSYDSAFWYGISYTNLFNDDYIIKPLLYKKAGEFGYELKAATGDYFAKNLIFMKSSAPAK